MSIRDEIKAIRKRTILFQLANIGKPVTDAFVQRNFAGDRDKAQLFLDASRRREVRRDLGLDKPRRCLITRPDPSVESHYLAEQYFTARYIKLLTSI